MVVFSWIAGCFLVIVYIVGIFIDCSTVTITDVKFHEGGFLNLGYTTHSNRELTSRDVRMALIWPIRALISFFKTTIWILNDIVVVIFLIFGFKYKNTKLYSWVNNNF